MRSKLLAAYKNLNHGVIGRKYKIVDYQLVKEDFLPIFRRRGLNKFFAIKRTDLIFYGGQQHTNRVALVKTKKRGQLAFPRTDALVTNQKNSYLFVYTADCLPLLFYSPQREVIAAAHAGYRGVLNGVAERVVKMMVSKFQVNKRDINIFVGPAILSCHYNIGRNVEKLFIKKFGRSVIKRKSGEIYLDLEKSLKIQLIKCGILPEKIDFSHVCTVCRNQDYYSARKEGLFGKSRFDSNWTFIGLKQ